jgi:tRNA (guanine-N7-)-methyltransferase
MADARVAFDRLLDEKSIQSIHALFPCPWPKQKHAKHRLFSRPFLTLLSSRLVEEGELLLVTDDRIYHGWILKQIPDKGFHIQRDMVPRQFYTKYEEKWHRMGQDEFFQIKLEKKHHLKRPVKEDLTLKTLHIKRFNPQEFRPRNARGEITVDFKEFLYDQEKEKGMVRTVIVEEHFIQHVWIDIAKGSKDWLIQPAKGCSMLPTAGVQRALDLVRDGAL